MDKIEAFEGMNLDGHCPMLRGKELNAYLAAGIQNCHETVSLEEGKEKESDGQTEFYWKHGRQMLRDYLNELGYTDTILHVRAKRLQNLLAGNDLRCG